MSVPAKLLDDPGLWRKVHNLWISEIYHCLKPQVAGRFSISIDQEVMILEIGEARSRLRPDLHLTEKPRGPSARLEPPGIKGASRAVAYAEGIEECSTESRHFIVLRDLGGLRVVAVLEVLSPTNKGLYSRLDLDSFGERRQRLLAGDLSYLEIDAVPAGTRWLPMCLQDLSGYSGVAWSSLPGPSGRIFKGWAWSAEGPLPLLPWDLGTHGAVDLDLDMTLGEALLSAGLQGA